jgi:hypothetical protein
MTTLRSGRCRSPGAGLAAHPTRLCRFRSGSSRGSFSAGGRPALASLDGYSPSLGPNKVPKLGKIDPDPAGGGTSALGGGAAGLGAARFFAFFFGAARFFFGAVRLALVFFSAFFLRAGAARFAFFFDFLAFFRFFAMIGLPMG